MGDVLCMDDVPFQCQTCKTHFSSGGSLRLHCFLENHRGATNRYSDKCKCGQKPEEPHQCNTCTLIGVNVEGDRKIEKPDDRVYAQSQLWKCSGCGMLWKCVDCGIHFKGPRMFKQHLPRCQNVEDVLRWLKREKDDDDDESEAKEKKFIKEEKYNTDFVNSIKEEKVDSVKEEKVDSIKEEKVDSIKEEKVDSIKEEKVDSIKEERVDSIKEEKVDSIKEEKVNFDAKFPIRPQDSYFNKQERDLEDNKVNIKPDRDGSNDM